MLKERLKKIFTSEVGIPHEHLWLSFFLPVFILGAIFLALGIRPFGHATLLTNDLYHQIAPFLLELRRKIYSGDSLFFSWNIALGTSFLPSIAYYCASPLNILTLLFPEKYFLDVITLMVLIRVGLSGLSFSLFVRGKYGAENKFVLLGSILYALSGFVLSYNWVIMWMDAYVLLPLIVLGIWKIITEKRFILYVATLFLAIYSNFYMGFIVCIFSLIFSFILFFDAKEQGRSQPIVPVLFRFFAGSIVAAGMSAVLTFPVLAQILSSVSGSGTFSEMKFVDLTFTPFDLASRLMFFSDPVIRVGLPNIYCGVIAFSVIPLYIACRRFSIQRKVLMIGLLMFMYLSMAMPRINLLWHGMRSPHQFPYRQSFLFIFVLVIMLVEILVHFDFSGIKIIVVSFVLCVSTIVATALVFDRGMNMARWVTSLGALTLYFAIYLYMQRKKDNEKLLDRVSKILLLAVILEVFFFTGFALRFIVENEGLTFDRSFAQHAHSISSEVDQIDSNQFYRSVLLPEDSSNDGASLDIKSLSGFTSLLPRETVQFFSGLGLANNDLNSIGSDGLAPASRMLLGVRHVISYDDGMTVSEYLGKEAITDPEEAAKGFNEQSENMIFGDYRIATDDRVLPIGYLIPESAMGFMMSLNASAFANTNAFAQRIGAAPLYQIRDFDIMNQVNIEEAEDNQVFSVIASEEASYLELQPQGFEEGERVYLHIQNVTKVGLILQYKNLDTQEISEKRFIPEESQIVDCGLMPESNEIFTIRVLIPAHRSVGDVRIALASSDTAAIENAFELLNQSTLEDIKYTSRSFSGIITVSEGDVLLLTVPYDKGWHATVDGKHQESEKAFGALLSIRLSEGKHTVSFNFEPEGFRAGVATTLISILAFTSMCIFLEPKKYRSDEARDINHHKSVL